jgi:hypothetical protein
VNLISTIDAAEGKAVTRQAIIKAIERGDIDGHRVGQRSLVVVANRKYERWEPNRVRQTAGLARKRKDRR